jgi:hypothetical protein
MSQRRARREAIEGHADRTSHEPREEAAEQPATEDERGRCEQRGEGDPNMFVLGAMTGKESMASSSEMKDKIFVAYPTLPADITAEGVAEFRALHEKFKFAPRHAASQLSAFAIAKIFVEGLTRTGKDLSREKLIKTLEGFYEFETGTTPRITFGPNRRIGAAGAHVLSFDLLERDFASASGWIKAY